MAKAYRVLVADDHPVVRQGIKQILQDAHDIAVGGEAKDGDEVLKRVRSGGWDGLVLDLSMPARNGLDLLQQIKRETPKLPVLILSMHAEDQFAVRLLRAGASGYVAKESAPEELVKAVRKVCSGGKYISPSLAEMLADNLEHPSSKAPHDILSDREHQVLLMIGAGSSIKEIGEELRLSVKTVSTYRTRILQKMGLRTNAQLIRYAIREKLVRDS
ncbi:MAG: response regulator transcription factor [Nitrospirae bacterium]|nr:MAG: response regulator transcription factor [Nitrospirota bacterium]